MDYRRNRSKYLDELHREFDRCANALCDATGGLFCQITSEYKGEESPENLRCLYGKIYYKMFAVRFQYTAHGMLGLVNSILDCSVFLDKSEAAVGIPLPMFMDYCDVDIQTPLCIPAITGTAGMQEAFGCIGNVLKDALPVITEICIHSEHKEKICDAFWREVKYICDINEADDPMCGADSFIGDFFTLRFSSDAFIAYMKGNPQKAAKRLSKTKKLTGYEKRMLKLWQSQNHSELPKLPELQTGLAVYNQSGSPKGITKELWVMLISWIILVPLPSALYVGIYFLLMFLEGRTSVYLMGPFYNFPSCIIFGFITAISISYFTRFRFYKLLFKSNYEQYCQQDYVQNGRGADRFMKGFTAVLVALSLLCCLFLVKWNLNFQSEGFYDNTKFFALRGAYYDYKEIDYVYYKSGRVNDLGDRLDYPSYVMVLKDGREIDFYDYDEIQQYEEKLISFLHRKGIRIEESKPE